MSEVAAQTTMEEYAVSEACIACDACCNDFPDIFIMNPEHTRAKAVAPSPKGKFNPWDIIYVCPVDAISLIKGELPPAPENKKKAKVEDLPPPEDNRPWEVRWAEAKKRGPESEWDRMKRYGLASELEEEVTKYQIRFALPNRVPDHQLKYKWNLPEVMPDYKFDIKLSQNGKTLFVKGWLEDDHVKKLCGIANSFPDRFYREIILGQSAKEVSFNYNSKDKVLDVFVEKAAIH
ncbi:MAG: ferredoxin [Deltaproteobacteria bacterium]|nr:MAG: ferredoxin [Deltaproteobacteria bacterium]